MLHELTNPEKCVQLIIFEWDFKEILGPFLDYTQASRTGQLKRAHCVIRRDLKVLASLKGKSSDGGTMWEPDAADGPWETKLEPIINRFAAKHHDWQ